METLLGATDADEARAILDRCLAYEEGRAAFVRDESAHSKAKDLAKTYVASPKQTGPKKVPR